MNHIQQFIYSTLLSTLTDRERLVASQRQKDVFGYDVPQKTYRQIGKMIHLTPEAVRTIVIKINKKIERQIYLIKRSMEEPQVLIKYIEKPAEKPVNQLIVYKPIEALGDLCTRTHNCLKNEEIKTIEELLNKTPTELLRVPNFGKVGLNELTAVLAKHDLKLKNAA